MIDFHFDENRQTRVVGSLNEVRPEIEQEITAKVALAYNVWTKSENLLSATEFKLKKQMRP